MSAILVLFCSLRVIFQSAVWSRMTSLRASPKWSQGRPRRTGNEHCYQVEAKTECRFVILSKKVEGPLVFQLKHITASQSKLRRGKIPQFLYCLNLQNILQSSVRTPWTKGVVTIFPLCSVTFAVYFLFFNVFLLWSRSILIQRRASFDRTRCLQWFNPQKVV